MSIDPATAIGAVHLTVSDLDRSIGFYLSHLGFVLHHREGPVARLGAGGPDLLVLTGSKSAPPRERGTTGLYHFAILVPSRLELAHVLRRLVDRSAPLQGVADHGVSESLYLADPDDIGIEIYRDRPPAEWPFVNGQLQMGVDPLNVDGLLAELKTGPGTGLARETLTRETLARETTMGHVHLQVAHMAAAEHFYVDVMGFDLMQRFGRSAMFVSAGGYHHHLGLNTWAGAGAPPPPGAIGLQYFVVRLPDQLALDEVAVRLREEHAAAEPDGSGLLTQDPSGNVIRLSLD